MKRPITTASIGEQITEILREQILSGELKPGTEIRQEAIANDFQVSRIPVRDAIQVLERDGLIILKPNRRAVVAEITDEDLSDHYEVRALIEGELAARAASKPQSLERLEATFRNLENIVKSEQLEGIVSANADFHQAVWELAGSPRMTAIAQQLWNGISPYRPVIFPNQAATSHKEHDQILRAIREGNIDLARDAMKNHIFRAQSDLLKRHGESQ